MNSSASNQYLAFVCHTEWLSAALASRYPLIYSVAVIFKGAITVSLPESSPRLSQCSKSGSPPRNEVLHFRISCVNHNIGGVLTSAVKGNLSYEAESRRNQKGSNRRSRRHKRSDLNGKKVAFLLNCRKAILKKKCVSSLTQNFTYCQANTSTVFSY